jgi:hypothetical protein
MGSPIVCEWGPNSSYTFNRRVTLGPDACTVTFERYHWPRRFWALRPDRCYTCQLADVLEIHRDSGLTRLLGRGGG